MMFNNYNSGNNRFIHCDEMIKVVCGYCVRVFYLFDLIYIWFGESESERV